MSRRPAILLLGPTASGKTPLGELLAERGLDGRPCRHFDFGAELRRAGARDDEAAADADGRNALPPAERAVVRDVLASGALLTDEQFPIARKILRAALARWQVSPETLVVLNGLPRHAGQASDLADVLWVAEVIVLEADADTLAERIRTNVGGDRTSRTDDAPPAVARKLAIYRQQTLPLIDHYRAAGAAIRTLAVTATTTPEDAWEFLQAGA